MKDTGKTVADCDKLKSSGFLAKLNNKYACRGYLKEIANKVLLAAITAALALWVMNLIISGIKQLDSGKRKILEQILDTLPPASTWISIALFIIGTVCFSALLIHDLWARFRFRRVGVIISLLSAVSFLWFVVSDNPRGEAIASIGLLLSLCYLLWPQIPKLKHEADDQLHRSFFSNRLVELLTSESPPLRRIAITAPWGEGKTYLLRLIDTGLKAKKTSPQKSFTIQTLWVNPWKASSQREALEIFAAAFDRIHPSTSISKIIRKVLPAMKSVSSLAPETKFGNLVLEAISSHYPEESKLDLERIDQTLEMRRIRLVVFVDDMERADPSAVRGILPVIDKLTHLTNCFFVFGIDRDRIEDAFLHLDTSHKHDQIFATLANEARSGDRPLNKAKSYVSGFLDKVMDLQLEIPDCSDIELHHFARSIVKERANATPKLANAFETIRPFLPPNPRICKKFLDLAIHAELMYFSDYRDNERDFAAVFLVLIGESEFPGFRKALYRDRSWASFSKLELMEDSKKEKASSTEQRMHGVLEGLCSELDIPTNTEHPNFIKLQRLHSAISSRVVKRPLVKIKGGELPEWVTHDYMTRRHLPASEMEVIVRQWFQDQGERSFDDIIKAHIAEPPSDLPSTILQLLTDEIDNHVKLLSKLMLSEVDLISEEKDLSNFLKFTEKLNSHFSRSSLSRAEVEAINSFENDRTEIGPAIIKSLFKLIKECPIDSDSDDPKISEVRTERVSAICTILTALNLESKGRFLASLENRMLSNLGMYDMPKSVKSEVREIEERLKENLSESFSKLIRTQHIDVFMWPNRNPDNSPFIVYEPNRWLPWLDEENYDLKPIETLETDIENIELLADNLYEVVCRYFLKIAANPEGRDLRWVSGFKTLTQHKGGRLYIREWWSIALNHACEAKLEELMGLRGEAYERALTQAQGPSETQPQSSIHPDYKLDVATIESCFPLKEKQAGN